MPPDWTLTWVGGMEAGLTRPGIGKPWAPAMGRVMPWSCVGVIAVRLGSCAEARRGVFVAVGISISSSSMPLSSMVSILWRWRIF